MIFSLLWLKHLVEAVSTSLQRSSSNAQSVSTNAKHNRTASSQKRKNHSYTARAFRDTRGEGEDGVRESLLFSAAEAPFTRKDIMFRENPNIQITSMSCENDAFVRGFHPIPRVEDVKRKLSCDASLKFSELKM